MIYKTDGPRQETGGFSTEKCIGVLGQPESLYSHRKQNKKILISVWWNLQEVLRLWACGRGFRTLTLTIRPGFVF